MLGSVLLKMLGTSLPPKLYFFCIFYFYCYFPQPFVPIHLYNRLLTPSSPLLLCTQLLTHLLFMHMCRQRILNFSTSPSHIGTLLKAIIEDIELSRWFWEYFMPKVAAAHFVVRRIFDLEMGHVAHALVKNPSWTPCLRPMAKMHPPQINNQNPSLFFPNWKPLSFSNPFPSPMSIGNSSSKHQINSSSSFLCPSLSLLRAVSRRRV